MNGARAALPLALALVVALVACAARADAPPAGGQPRDDALGAVLVEVRGNPLLPLVDCPDWNCLGHTDSWVPRGADGELVAWFSTGGDLGGPIVGRARVSDGLTLKLDPPDRPVLQTAEGVWDIYRETVSTHFDPDGWDFAFVTRPAFVEAPDGQWRLYYVAAGRTIGVGLLLSDDRGATWRPLPGNPVFERDLSSWDQGIVKPSVLHGDDGDGGRYLM